MADKPRPSRKPKLKRKQIRQLDPSTLAEVPGGGTQDATQACTFKATAVSTAG